MWVYSLAAVLAVEMAALSVEMWVYSLAAVKAVEMAPKMVA